MYRKILVTLDATSADQTVLDHIRPLARQFGSRLILLHVADGWAARVHGSEAVSDEVKHDRDYLARRQAELRADGFDVETELGFGDPVTEIVNWVEREQCDLIAMSTHGHRFFGDLIHGATAHRVQHSVSVPVLLIRTKAR
jgi:nucleotide-binding universal stress UspA family protein